MPTGITANLQLDPNTKHEIWLFQQVGSTGPGNRGTPVFRRLAYNLVRYDGDPTQYIEPVNASQLVKVLDGSGDPISAWTDGAGRMTGIQRFTSRPFEVFSLNDYDVVNNGGQLP